MTRPEVAEFLAAELARLTRFVRRRMEGVGPVEAEDVVQDVALRLFAWRRKRRRGEFAAEAGELERLAAAAAPGAASDDPAAAAERRERLQRLAAAMEALPAEERAVITATEIEGRSYRELAEEWGAPIGTLLARKHRALGKLRVLVGAGSASEGGKQ